MTQFDKALKERVALLVGEIGFRSILEILLQCAQPKGIDQAEEMSEALMTGLTTCTAWEAFMHISEHEGYECAQRLIESTTDRVKQESNQHLQFLLRMAGKDPVPKTTNEQTYEAIMEEMKKNG